MDYKSKVSLLCPICNRSSFNDTGELFVCINCNNSYTRAQLEKANEGRIRKQINNIVEKKILPDFTKQFKSNLQNAFRNNPYIKIK